MRFYFDIEDYELEDVYYGQSFNEIVASKVTEEILKVVKDKSGSTLFGMAKGSINNLIQSKADDIAKLAAEIVAQKIERKKEIAALAPKASEIRNINKENEEYFCELIDKAIAKKFK